MAGRFVGIIVCCLWAAGAAAQCVSAFPYTEDFELSNGNWVAGGSGTDWAWGSVAKPVIQNAASGGNCWVTGGLTTSFYSFGQRSYVQSPCFNFSNLQYPYISFSVFWETEQTYDGANLQYSTDGGNTWQNVGSYTTVPDCNTQNWYNAGSINNLSGLAANREGWAGNIQPTQGNCQGGSGSSGWLTARHCLNGLGGQPNVLLRFAFGAGTTCNDYDGFAFDDVTIADGAPVLADFEATCSNGAVAFISTTTQCPNAFSWNFGDGNTANGADATHTYAQPGQYTVTFTATSACNPPVVVSKQVLVSGVTATAQNTSCAGVANGMAIATAQPAGNTYTYQWGTQPPQLTDTAFALPEGTYTVTVSGGVCPVTAQVSIGALAGMAVSVTTVPDTCFYGGGSATANVTGGSSPYGYVWSTGGAGSLLAPAAAGNYTLTVTDAVGCTAQASATVAYATGLNLQVETTPVLCGTQSTGSATVQVSGGAAPYQYQWTGAGNTAQVSGLVPGSYSVTVADANSCTDSVRLVVEEEPCFTYVYFPTAFSPNADGQNDYFKPRYTPNLNKYTLRVYNRWGELLYTTTDVTEGWDGTYKGIAQPLGVYVWLAEYNFNGEKLLTQSGNLTLMR